MRPLIQEKFILCFKDMFDPELYLSEYEYEDPKTGVSRISTCRYRESTDCSEDLISFNSAKTKHDQRFPYFCTIIPGLIFKVSERQILFHRNILMVIVH